MQTISIIFVIIFVVLFLRQLYIYFKSKQEVKKRILSIESDYLKRALKSLNQCSDFKKITKQLSRDWIDYTVEDKIGSTGRTEVTYTKRFPHQNKTVEFKAQFTYTGQHVGLLMF